MMELKKIKSNQQCSAALCGRGLALVLLIFLSLLQAGCGDVDSTSGLKWFKGNLHCHTSLKEGDATPEEVIDWYLEHDYDFVVITDHDLMLNNPGFRKKRGKTILALAGEEVSIAKSGIHVGAINLQRWISGGMGTLTPEKATLLRMQLEEKGRSEKDIQVFLGFAETVEHFDAVVQEVEQQGGISVFNHPAISVAPISFEKITGVNFVELWNPRQDNRFGTPSTEVMWDKALTSGRKLYAVSGDDAHQFKSIRGTHPGSTWVWVRAAELNPEAIVTALKRGDFYISTGITLKKIEYVKAKKQIVVALSAEKGKQYKIQFIGKGGTILKEVTSDRAAYTCQGNELYVRVKVFDQEGRKAYSQPFTISKLS